MKRLQRAVLWPLCFSILFSTVPVHAAEAGQENIAVEATATEGESVVKEGGEALSATEETAAAEETSAAEETVVTEEPAATETTKEGAEGANKTEEAVAEAATEETEEGADKTEEAVAEAAENADKTKEVVTEETEGADKTEEAATEATTESAAAETEGADKTGETGTEAAAEENAATKLTDTTAVSPEETAVVPAEETAVAEPEVVTAAAPALKAASGAVEKAAQMKLEVIDYLDEGFGDSQMLSSAGSKLLIDTYSPGSWDVLNSWLNDKKYNDFDIYISHYHNDHMGNVINILNDGKYKVSKLYLPDYSYMTGSNSYMQDYQSDCQDIMNTARSKGVQIVSLVKNSVFKVGDVIAEVLWGADYEDSSHDTDYINNNSLVTRFTCGNTRYLNAGDIEVDTEYEMLDAGVDLSADICKLSHHGGDTSNSYAFLEAVDAAFYYYNYCGDSPSKYSPSGSWSYGPTQNAKRFGNVASVRYNGEIT